MSRGIGVRAKQIEMDDTKVLYQYGPFNWNEPEYKNPDYEMDGLICIQLECLPIIEFHERNSKKSGKIKGQIKEIIEKHSSDEMIENGMLRIENSKYCWDKTEDTNIDTMALKAIWNMIRRYEEEGELPKEISLLS